MAIKISIGNKVRFKVRGTLKDENGNDQPFDFSLTCVRLDADKIQSKLRSDSEASVTDFLADVAEDWTGVKGADDKDLPYSTDNLRELLKIVGLATLAFHTYLKEVGAKEKN